MKKIAIITTLFLAAIISGCSNTKVTVNSEKSCQTDQDCEIVSKRDSADSCCFTCDEEVINQAASKAREEWWAENCQNGNCPIYDCYSEKLAVPRCIDDVCQIEWQPRNNP